MGRQGQLAYRITGHSVLGSIAARRTGSLDQAPHLDEDLPQQCVWGGGGGDHPLYHVYTLWVGGGVAQGLGI